MLSSWMVCKIKRDGTKVAECKYCRCELGTKNSELGEHRLTEKHKTAAACVPSAQSQLTFARAATPSSSAAEGTVARFVTASHLSGVIKKSFSDSLTARGGYHMKRTKCASLLVLYPPFKRDLAADVGESKFSIIVDDSTDISVTQVFVRGHHLLQCTEDQNCDQFRFTVS